MDDRRDGVEEGKRIGAGCVGDRLGKRRRGQWPCGNDRLVPVGRRQAGHFLALDGDQRVRFEPFRHRVRESVAVDGERAAGRHLVGVAGAHDQRAGQPHLGMQQADRVVFGIIGAEGIGTDELGQAIGLVRVRTANRAHFMQHDGNAGLRCLPCGF